MIRKKWHSGSKMAVFMTALLIVGTLSACGQQKETDTRETDTDDRIAQAGQQIAEADFAKQSAAVQEAAPEQEEDGADSVQTDTDNIKERFGDNCIAEQTFEVELSEYDGKVWFVPSLPDGAGQGIGIKIMQDGEVLTEPETYVPERLSGEAFDSLDAVSFYDVNYDGDTDIVLIATFGGSSFATVYYGIGHVDDGYSSYFVLQEALSEALSDRVEPLSVSEIRNYVSGGKKNGEFDGYREAYEATARVFDMESSAEAAYDLIYFDEDDIPELVAGYNGYSLSLYTYQDGTVYTLMDHSGYGAGGNAGYEYVPGMNSMRNYNSDYAGAIGYTTYLATGAGHTLDEVKQIVTFYFDDVNGNGILDENETESVGMYSVSYLDDVEITEQEAASCNVGEYEYIEGRMNLEELIAKLLDG